MHKVVECLANNDFLFIYNASIPANFFWDIGVRFLSWECWDFWRWHDRFRTFPKKSEVFRRHPKSSEDVSEVCRRRSYRENAYPQGSTLVENISAIVLKYIFPRFCTKFAYCDESGNSPPHISQTQSKTRINASSLPVLFTSIRDREEAEGIVIYSFYTWFSFLTWIWVNIFF